MPIKFLPNFSITNKMANALLVIEGVKERIKYLPVTTTVLSGLRKSAKLHSTHYSTMIEGNRLTQKDVQNVIDNNYKIPGKERDENEVKGYYRAITEIENIAKKERLITQKDIQKIHALLITAGSAKAKPSAYRDAQNVIKDSNSNRIVYMPPETKDVPLLMKALIKWLNLTIKDIPCPIRAGIAHYQFATIHPYYDGNGRTARLLTTLILHKEGYDLKGLYSLEEYYANNLSAYYNAISIGPSHNYYIGRAEADITPWLEYFIDGMADAFINVEKHTKYAALNLEPDQTAAIKKLDPKQRHILTLFHHQEIITSHDIAVHFGFSGRSARQLALEWSRQGFLEVVDSSKKGRKYKLSKPLMAD